MADVAEAPAAPSFKKRATNKNIRKRPATPPSASDSDDASDYSTDDEQGVRIKRRKKDGVNLAARKRKDEGQDFSKATKYQADRSTNITANDDATRSSTWYTDAALASTKPSTNPSKASANPTDSSADGKEGIYKGTSSYSTHIQKNPDPKPSVGPVKAPTNVRQIITTDFAPDVCKDYKQTGFCGFGDSCKFLHAREDYKQGWQLDKEWEKAGKQDKKDKPAGTNGKDGAGTEGMTEEEKLLEGIPFKCIICKSDYKVPVVTKCGHYFCEKCAMGRYMREKKRTCANCGADTGGSFGVARKLGELLKKKEKREEEKELEKEKEKEA